MTSFNVPAATLRTFIVANVTQRAPFCTERNGSIVKEPGGMQEQIQSPVVATVLPAYGDFCPDVSACRQESGMRICRRGQAAGDFLDRAAGLPAYGDFYPDRVGLPTGAVSRQHGGGQTDMQPVPGGKRQERSGRYPMERILSATK